MKIAVGPLLYHWPRRDLEAFYRELAGSSAQIIYLGETVCSKRAEWRAADWLEAAAMLRDAGKEVVLSTLALIEAESELGQLRQLCGNGGYWVEANDMAAVYRCERNAVPFVAGHALNVYNSGTLRMLLRCGMKRWVPPVELPEETLRDILREAKTLGLQESFQSEMLVWGRLPLAYSARCFTARAYDLPKDRCGFRCLDHSEGMPLRTQDGTAVLTLNGIQIQSGAVYNLCDQWQALAAQGVDILRVSPQSLEATLMTVEALSDALRSGGSPVLPEIDAEICNGYWQGLPGMTGAPITDH